MAKQPKTLGGKIDALYSLNLRISDAESSLSALKSAREGFAKEIIELLDKEESTGNKGRLANAVISELDTYSIYDSDKFYAYVHRNKAYDLLQKRVSSTSVRERSQDGKKVPGIKVFTRRSLKVTKLK